MLRQYAPRDLVEKWVPRLTSADYRQGALAGQAFTEKQGGSDLRRITTTAIPAGDGAWIIDGHKWFCSAPMCDVFLTIAKTSAGLSCFLVERGVGFQIVRLKDKLGTRSLPSAEIEFRGARGWLVGEDGRGMVPLVTNLSHARSGPAVSPEMRAALVAAIHHCRHRSAFGQRLADQPAMANVLADLAIESEGQTAALMHLSAQHGDDGSPMRRIATTVMEYWGCGRVTGHIAEAMQCLGGNGYSEASGLPRLLRDAAVHPIWEGSGNVVALDILRIAAKQPEAIAAFLDECAVARGARQTAGRPPGHAARTACRTGRLAESPSRCAPRGRGSGCRVHRESARALLHLRRCRCLLRGTAGARPRPGSTAPCPPKSTRAPSSIVRFPHERRLIPEIESRRTLLSAYERRDSVRFMDLARLAASGGAGRPGRNGRRPGGSGTGGRSGQRWRPGHTRPCPSR